MMAKLSFSIPLEQTAEAQPEPATFQRVEMTWTEMTKKAKEVCPHKQFTIIVIETGPTAHGSLKAFFKVIALGKKRDVKPGIYLMKSVGLKLGGKGTLVSLYYIPSTGELFAWDEKNQQMFKAV